MSTAPIVISIVSAVVAALAFTVSLVHLYFNWFHRRRAFHLVRITLFPVVDGVEFALVNDGKKGLLVTHVKFFLKAGPNDVRYTPLMRKTCNDQPPALLPSGKAITYRFEFVEELDASFTHHGIECERRDGLLWHMVFIEVQWAEMDGSLHTATIPYMGLGFDEQGRRKGFSPGLEQYDLFKSASESAEALKGRSRRRSIKQ